MTACTHIIGNAWMMNPSEGPAFITRFVGGGQIPPHDDWVYTFRFCPCCGVELKPVTRTAVELASTDAHWKG